MSQVTVTVHTRSRAIADKIVEQIRNNGYVQGGSVVDFGAVTDKSAHGDVSHGVYIKFTSLYAARDRYDALQDLQRICDSAR